MSRSSSARRVNRTQSAPMPASKNYAQSTKRGISAASRVGRLVKVLMGRLLILRKFGDNEFCPLYAELAPNA
jgi:hypothetical protein